MRKNLSRKQALSQLTAHIERHGDVYDRTTSRQLWERKYRNDYAGLWK